MPSSARVAGLDGAFGPDASSGFPVALELDTVSYTCLLSELICWSLSIRPRPIPQLLKRAVLFGLAVGLAVPV